MAIQMQSWECYYSSKLCPLMRMQHLRLSSRPLPLPGWAQSADLKQTCPIKDTHMRSNLTASDETTGTNTTQNSFLMSSPAVCLCVAFSDRLVCLRCLWRVREKYQQLIKSRPCSSRSHLLCRLNMAMREREGERGARESISTGVNCAISPCVLIEDETDHDSNVRQGTPAFKEH